MNVRTTSAYKTYLLATLAAFLLSACADKDAEGLSGGKIPASLVEFSVKGDKAAKNFTVLDKLQEGQWTAIVLKRQSVHGNEKFMQLKIDCAGPNFIIVRDYAPTLEAMKSQAESSLEQPKSIDVFWGELANTVCAAN